MSAATNRLLSRAAESVFWMSRYIERAENVARFIGVNLHLQLDLPTEQAAHQWQPLIDTSGDAAPFRERYNVASQFNVISFLTLDAANPNSIFSCLRAARENARSVRETISSPAWEQVNRMYLQLQAHQSSIDQSWLPEILQEIRQGCQTFQGITDATMSHDEAWHFLRLGGLIERADKTSRILDVKYFILLPSNEAVGTPYDDLHWAAVLKSVDGFEMYRKRHGRISPKDIVDFLVVDRDFPRAIHYCIERADTYLHAITGTPVGRFQYSSERLMGLLRSEIDFASVEHIIAGGLHEYLDSLQVKLNGIGDAVHSDFFASHVAPAPKILAGMSGGNA